MEALTLTRTDYLEGLERVNEAASDGNTYLDKFKIKFPEGLNTATSLEICRLMTDPTMETKIRIAKICMAGRNVEVVCPNGETEKFHLNSPDDSLEGFPLFAKEPLALLAIADSIYGHILKKSLRLSKPQAVAKEQI